MTDHHAAQPPDWMNQLQDAIEAARQEFDGLSPEQLSTLRAQGQVIGSLLVGRAFLFGVRIELAWPDGLPRGVTEETLRDLGQSILDQA